MKRKFTLLNAALALLAFLTPATMGWGQTRSEVTDVMNQTWTGISGTTYSAKTNLAGSASDAVYTVQCAGGNNSIQLRSNSNNSGIVSTTSAGTVTKVTVTWNTNTANGRTLNVYGKNSAYSTPSDLYGNNAGTLIGTIVCGTSTELEINDDYEYIGMRSASGAMYLDEIKVTWTTSGGSTSVATTTTIDATGITNTDVYTSTAAGSLTATVTETESGNAVSGATVTWTSSKENVATIDEDGVVTLVAAGTTTITASYAGVSGEFGASSATYDLTVTSSAPYVQPTEFEIGLNNALFGTSHTGSVSGVTDEYPIVGTQDNVTVTYAGGGNHYVNDNQIRFYPSNKLTFEAPSGYEIKEIVFTSAGTWAATISADGGTYDSSTKTWTGSATSVLFTGSGSSRCDMSKATITLGEPSSIAIPTFDPEGGIYTTTQSVTISTTTDGATIYYTTDGNDPTTSSTEYTAALSIDATTTIKAIAAVGSDVSSVASATYTIFPIEHEGTEADPYTVADARNAIDANTGLIGVYATGIVSEIVTPFNAQYGNITYNISADGSTTSDQLQAYRGKSFNGENFTSENDIQVGATVVVYGTLKKYSNIYEFDAGNQLVEYTASTTPTVTLSTYEINATAEGAADAFTVTCQNMGTNLDIDVWTCDATGESFAEYGWFETEVNGTEITYIIYPNEGAARTAYLKVIVADTDAMETYSSELLTITQAAAPQQYTLTVAPFENLDLITFVNGEMVMEGDGEIQVNEGDQIMLSIVALEGYEMGTLMVNGVDHVNEIESDFTYTFNMPAENVTITATAVKALQTAKYVLATSVVSGRHYIIVGFDGDNAYAMGSQSSNNRKAVGITISDGVATGNANVYEFVISTDATNSAWFNIYDGVNEGYLYAAGGSGNNAKNYLKIQSELTDNGRWTIEINQNGVATITAQGDANRNIMRYNSSNTIFSCYASGQQDIYLYERVYTMDIAAHGTNENPSGWYLIASPVGDVDATAVTNLVNVNNNDGFDFYRFDQNEELEWQNWKNEGANHYHFNLDKGRGYLYANATNTTITFTGVPNTTDSVVTLHKSVTGEFSGWNLVGNPLGQAAYIPANRNFYVMNETGSEIIAGESNRIEPMQGLFVIAETDGETITFNPEKTAKSNEGIVTEITEGRGSVIDRAIVRFGESNTLPKLQLFENSTKLFIEKNGKDYAIVSAEAQGEMPVSFRAAKNGIYTLTVNPEGVEMNYLHLIDNMTGMDIDLLQTPNYTFEARTTDYTSRFRLVFDANGASAGSASDDTFAYFNGCEWMINNSGDATLQVVDVMGRVFSSEVVSGSVSKTINATPGVYMLRLVSGDTVKTQKIVVR